MIDVVLITRIFIISIHGKNNQSLAQDYMTVQNVMNEVYNKFWLLRWHGVRESCHEQFSNDITRFPHLMFRSSGKQGPKNHISTWFIFGFNVEAREPKNHISTGWFTFGFNVEAIEPKNHISTGWLGQCMRQTFWGKFLVPVEIHRGSR